MGHREVQEDGRSRGLVVEGVVSLAVSVIPRIRPPPRYLDTRHLARSLPDRARQGKQIYQEQYTHWTSYMECIEITIHKTPPEQD